MNRARSLVERVSGLEETRRLAVDRELVCALDHVSECVVTGVAVRRTGGRRRALDQDNADFSPRDIREWLREDLLHAWGCGLGGRRRDLRGAQRRDQGR